LIGAASKGAGRRLMLMLEMARVIASDQGLGNCRGRSWPVVA